MCEFIEAESTKHSQSKSLMEDELVKMCDYWFKELKPELQRRKVKFHPSGTFCRKQVVPKAGCSTAPDSNNLETDVGAKDLIHIMQSLQMVQAVLSHSINRRTKEERSQKKVSDPPPSENKSENDGNELEEEIV